MSRTPANYYTGITTDEIIAQLRQGCNENNMALADRIERQQAEIDRLQSRIAELEARLEKVRGLDRYTSSGVNHWLEMAEKGESSGYFGDWVRADELDEALNEGETK